MVRRTDQPPRPLTVLALHLLAIGVLPVSVQGDSVELDGGGQVVGASTVKGGMTLVAVDEDLQIAFEGPRVRRVLQSEQLSQYHQRAKQAGENAEAHYQLARWCAAAGNVPGMSDHFSRFHMTRTIELDPSHSKARTALGYRLERGEWVKVSELFTSRGMVRRKGKWAIPEAVAHNRQFDEDENASKQWTRDIKKMVAIIGRGPSGKRYAETLENLKAIEDPRAANAVSEQLIKSRPVGNGTQLQPQALRFLWVDLLGQFKNSTSVETLVRSGLEEPDQAVRERILDKLVEYGSGSAKASYLAILRKNSSHEFIGRAARALSWFPDHELAEQYVRALRTTFTQKAAPGAKYNLGFGDNGGTSSFGGSKQKVISTTRENPAVLALVKQVIPEQDFGYDESQWLQFLADQKTKYSGDLRRDP